MKKSLKIGVPKVSIDIASTSSTSKQSTNSKNEVHYLKTTRTCGVKVDKQPSKAKVPPEIITVPDSDEASITKLDFSEDESTPSKKVCASSTVQQKQLKNNEGSMFSGLNQNHQEKVSYLDNKRRHETAFSATSPIEINDIDKNKKIKKVSTRPPDTVKTSSIDHQKNLKEHKTQEDIMHEVSIHHKTIMDYANHSHKNDAIDHCRYNHQNMIDEDYTGIIKRELPKLHNALNPIPKKHIIQELRKITLNTRPQGWEEFGKIRSRELRNLEKTIVFNQMVKNNFSHAWKQIYKEVNDFCNEYRIPNENRINLFRKEMEYVSLYIHDILPLDYNEQGIHQNDCSISKHTKFFSRDDSLPVARKKWHDYILYDYNYFWDVYSHKINFRVLSDSEIVKLQDIYEIIYFINPEGIRAILGNPETNALVCYIYQRFLKVKNWVTTRHYSYYTWKQYGWKEIPSHFPSFDSSSDPRSVILSRWVPKSVPYDEYIKYDHYIITDQKNTKNHANQDLVPARISSYKQKLILMPRSHFEEKFSYYDSVMNATPSTKDYRSYFYGIEKENKRKIYFKTIKIHHQHLYNVELEREKAKYSKTRNLPLDWLVWYDYYNQKLRRANYLYGYNVQTAQYFQDPSYSKDQGLIKFGRNTNENLVPVDPTDLQEVYTKYAKYPNNIGKSTTVPYNNLMVRKNFEKDILYW